MEAVGIGVFRVLLVMVLVVFGAYILIKLLGAVGWLVSRVFRGIGRGIAHVGRFVVGMVRDVLHMTGACITILFYLPALALHVVFARWSAANHYGRAIEQESLTVGGCIYRLAIGHVAHLLCLSPLTDGVERRMPDVIARTPRSGPFERSGPSDRFSGYKVVGSLQAGGSYDGAFFNWMTPGFAAGAREKVEAGAAEAGREAPPVHGYVRTAVGADAPERLAKEESFYRDLHDGYRNHFARLGEPEGTVGVAAADADTAREALAAYSALDTIVVRGLASASLESMSAVAEAAAP
jgi:hypothetical protein